MPASLSQYLTLVASPPEASLLYVGHYDALLVSLSVAAAVLASYAALLVSRYVAETTVRWRRNLWTVVGGMSLGLGIWAMHFVGMLAFSLPCTTHYDTMVTMVSTIPGILASTFAIRLIGQTRISRPRLASGALLIGSGIGAMHYSGMAAMRFDGLIRYDAGLFFLSIVVAVLLAASALWVKLRLQTWRGFWGRFATLTSALIMGLAVSGMHYTAMAAAYFVRGDAGTVNGPGMQPEQLASIVLTATILILITTVVAMYLGKSRFLDTERPYKAIALLVTGWVGIAGLSSDYYYTARATETYARQYELAAHEARDIAADIQAHVEFVKGVARLFAAEVATRQTLQQAGQLRPPGTEDTPEIRRRRWSTDPFITAFNHRLDAAAEQLQVGVIYLLDSAGTCVAAANAYRDHSFVGFNYGDRTYFRQAMDHPMGHQYAIGRTSHEPGLYYAAPIRIGDTFQGAVVVKQPVARLSPLLGHTNAFISDVNGVVVLANDKRLEFQALPDAGFYAMPESKRLAQYQQVTMAPLTIAPWGDNRYPSAVHLGAERSPVTLVTEQLPEDGIAIHVPRPLSEMQRFEGEELGLFILLATTGSLFIISAATVLFHLQQAQRTSAELRVAATAFASQESIMITDANGIILRVNPAFTEINGYEQHEVVGKTPSLLHSGRQDAEHYAQLWQAIKTSGHWEGEIWNRRKNGEVYPGWLTISAVEDSERQVTHYVGTLTDMTQRKEAETKIERLAYYDSLTKLPNRQLLNDRMQRALLNCARSNGHGAILFIDLDNFKTLNDTHGHDWGDALLQEVARRIESRVRATDTVARLGGDEFIVVLEDLGDGQEQAAAKAEEVGEQLLLMLEKPHEFHGYRYQSSGSIGITLFNQSTDSAQELLKRADIAMYEAKLAGRNTLRFFDPQMQAVVSRRAALEADLRRGLQASQFQLLYQPQVDIDGHMTGVEALVRWQHPDNGTIPPNQFIPLAEETGLILALSDWVLETACRQLVAWADDPRCAHLTMAVNISARQFNETDFADRISHTIERTGADRRKLKLEITESLLLERVDEVLEKMSVLRERGLRFSLDDFGTGYSSLSYLKRLHLDQLKIDRSFVNDVLTDGNDASIARTIVALGHSLGMSVIAEGVESRAQFDFLNNIGCHAYQGYYFARPVSAAEVTELAHARQSLPLTNT